MVYEIDEYGEYQIIDTWIEAWPGGGSYVAGWCTMELRRYTDGMMRVCRGQARYVDKATPELGVLHEVYLMAARALRNAIPRFPAHPESSVDRGRSDSP